ncbi:DUF930 domain-containing protein [Agrobacterium larrymoorei]|uniref:DUF930 domain-containing protein n=1 Tax=Agrobacterium larrymoorei TaxID=160699 RepID=A0A4D7DSK2_9HYPH|nr:DUF930 domain-containing protein [Agrobacterium larrymoorei]QCI97259.1 DUF930 domain-containing protein [Agrobacterium larrymoorei]QYA07309.1 DUF930 domain-containing protein [Agrobacterium larrymoorei]
MQATAPQSWNGLGPLGTSAIFHLAAIFALIFLHFTPLKPAAPESTVSVELLPADSFDDKNTAEPSEEPKVDARAENVTREADVAKPLSPESPATKDQTEEGSPTSSAPKTETKSSTFVRASHFYASEVLKNSKSKGTASDLRKLSPEERMIQLCNLEAMEQVSRWKTRIKADFLVSYAMADTRRNGQKITADGAAVRSKGHWYNLKYSCQVAASMEAVDAFEFALGDEIPEAKWDAYSLPAGENFDD